MSSLVNETISELRERIAAAVGIEVTDVTSREQSFLFKQKVAAFVLNCSGELTSGHIAALFGRRQSWVNCIVEEMEGRCKIVHFKRFIDRVETALMHISPYNDEPFD